MRLKIAAFLLFAIAAAAHAQGPGGGISSQSAYRFHGAATLPATCATNDVVGILGVPWICGPANTWTKFNSGSGSGSGLIPCSSLTVTNGTCSNGLVTATNGVSTLTVVVGSTPLNLEIHGGGLTASAADQIQVQLNGDTTTGHYNTDRSDGAQFNTTPQLQLGSFAGTGGSASFDATFHNLGGSNVTFNSLDGYRDGSSHALFQFWGSWVSTGTLNTFVFSGFGGQNFSNSATFSFTAQ